APKITNQRSIALTSVEQWEDRAISRVQDYLAVEEPLEIRIGEIPLAVTMRTPGHDLELAAGFLFTEGIVADASELRDIQPIPAPSSGNAISADLENGFDPGKLQRNFFSASSCGICGKQAIEAIRVRGVQPLSS